MTESEAKTKWCPMVVFMLGGGMVRNRDACFDNEGTHCIGSACMMWRAYGPPSLADVVARAASGMSIEDARQQLLAEYPDGRQGHCGLAGKP